MPFPPRLNSLARMAAVMLMTVGCTREIGDSCNTGTDCSQTGGRTCDTTMPGGYCTIANCEPDSCPEEAACIGFFSKPSTAEACQDLLDPRELRQFCMRRCSSQDDCRAGYVCADLNAAPEKNPWGAKRLDNASADGRVCALPYSAVSAADVDKAAKTPEEKTRANYCSADAYEDPGYYSVGGSSAVSQNTAGNAGTAGTAGAGAMSSSAGTAGTAGDTGQAGNVSGGGTSGAGNVAP